MAAKARKKHGSLEGPVLLDWSLAELPSSQHRAGLAGLVSMVEWVGRDPDPKGVCQLTRLDRGGATLQVDASGLGRLLDATYEASLEEVRSARPWKNKEAKRIDAESVPPKRPGGKPTLKTWHVYERPVPEGAWLQEVEPPAGDGSSAWLKLWRDFIWAVPRGVPKQRGPYERRAGGRPAERDVDAILSSVLATGRTASLTSTYFLGGQDRTADMVDMRDLERNRFLLHFWPFASRVYVPAKVDPRGNRDFDGYAVAVPDVATLDDFVQDLRESLRSRSSEMDGYRPRDAVVSIPGEAGLDFLAGLRQRVAATESRQRTSDLVLGIDVFHLAKEGNNVRMRSVSRVDPDPRQVDAYTRLRRAYRSPSFRRQRLLNLLAGGPWWSGFDQLAARCPHSSMVGDRWFRLDARNAFERTEEESMEQRSENEPRGIEEIVYAAVGTYISARLRSRHDLAWEDVKDGDGGKRKEYDDKREKVAREAFLAVRARSGGDFTSYFAGTLCSGGQYLSAADYRLLAGALHREPERVRTLTLLALSARG